MAQRRAGAVAVVHDEAATSGGKRRRAEPIEVLD